ncbi:MAG TPA: hypothetical protein VL172_06125, partial [Kofleriaceae bacterium]|nr:hypothetical protein [Kofleriaceae bacterium]
MSGPYQYEDDLEGFESLEEDPAAPALAAGKKPRTKKIRAYTSPTRPGPAVAGIPGLARMFGVDVNRVEVGRPLAEVAHADDRGNLRFRDSDPSPRVVAEEVVHLAQMRLGRGPAEVSSPGDPAEREAGQMADRIADGQWAGMPSQPASAGLMLFTDAEIAAAEENIRALAASTVIGLDNALDGTWGDRFWNWAVAPQRARALISEYFTQVRRTISGAGTAFDYLLDRSRERLQRAYVDLCGRVLQTDISTQVDEPYRAEILGWISVTGVARPAADT